MEHSEISMMKDPKLSAEEAQESDEDDEQDNELDARPQPRRVRKTEKVLINYEKWQRDSRC